MRQFFLPTLVCMTLWAAGPTFAAEVPSAPVHKSLKALIGGIRYGKDDLAARHLGLSKMAQTLLGEQASTLSPAQRQEFEKLFDQLVRKICFAAGRDLFAYLDAVLYAPAQAQGTQILCRSTVVVHRDLKKQEIPIEWTLEARGSDYLVVDMKTGGESTLAAIRQDQILPLLQEGGPEALLAAMRKKLQAGR